MKDQSLDCLTERHLLLFGSIIQWFARYELLIQEVMTTVAGSDSASVMLLTRGLDFGNKRQALLDLLRQHAIPLDQFDGVCEYLIVPHTLMQLWTDIVHSTWTPGLSPKSIQPDWILHLTPTVKPWRNDSALPSENFVELGQDKVAWSLSDLTEVVETLATNYEGFSDYLRKVALIAYKPKAHGQSATSGIAHGLASAPR